MSFWLARPCCVIVSLCALPVVALGTFTLQKFRVFFIWPPCDSSTMLWDVGICTEKASAVVRIPQFKHVCKANSHPKGPLQEYGDLKTNCVSSGEVLTIGPLHLSIIIAWSCDPSGILARHSMIGVAVFNTGEKAFMSHQSLTLVNNESAKSKILTRRNVGIPWWGSYPYPYADHREVSDGFVLLSDVFDSSRGWLSQDEGTLTVSCDVELALSRIQPLQPNPIPTFRTEDIVSHNIAILLESRDHSDVTLTVGAEEICAHSLILAAHSPVFNAAFSHNMKEVNERNVVIEGLDLSAVRRMLAFMYNGKLDISESGVDVCNLLQAAHRYQVTPLVDSCVLAMKSQITEQVAVEYLLQADLLGISSLKNACVKFAVSSGRRLAAIQRTESFARLVEKQPHLLLELLSAACHLEE
eukprot:TRINITY_DN12926_c0_g1_i3.p1 TRINITY_DN12926_c0_g1~~TRINITY_DN12926_c0_g1_i3.p1  ORF type:complete len:413 (-),score=35.02 TRINITY_DN12926_c0_g1_i3:674-1912(-)